MNDASFDALTELVVDVDARLIPTGHEFRP